MYENRAGGLFLSFLQRILISVSGLCFFSSVFNIKKSSLAESDCLLIKVILFLTGKSLKTAYIKFRNPRNIAIAKVILFLKPFSYLINIVLGQILLQMLYKSIKHRVYTCSKAIKSPGFISFYKTSYVLLF